MAISLFQLDLIIAGCQIKGGNNCVPSSWSRQSLLFGKGKLSFLCLGIQCSVSNAVSDTVIFLTSTGAEAHSEVEGVITPASSIFARCFSSCSWYHRGVLRSLCFTGRSFPVSNLCVTPFKLLTIADKELLQSFRLRSIQPFTGTPIQIHKMVWDLSVTRHITRNTPNISLWCSNWNLPNFLCGAYPLASFQLYKWLWQINCFYSDVLSFSKYGR